MEVKIIRWEQEKIRKGESGNEGCFAWDLTRDHPLLTTANLCHRQSQRGNLPLFCDRSDVQKKSAAAPIALRLGSWRESFMVWKYLPGFYCSTITIFLPKPNSVIQLYHYVPPNLCQTSSLVFESGQCFPSSQWLLKEECITSNSSSSKSARIYPRWGSCRFLSANWMYIHTHHL